MKSKSVYSFVFSLSYLNLTEMPVHTHFHMLVFTKVNLNFRQQKLLCIQLYLVSESTQEYELRLARSAFLYPTDSSA